VGRKRARLWDTRVPANGLEHIFHLKRLAQVSFRLVETRLFLGIIAGAHEDQRHVHPHLPEPRLELPTVHHRHRQIKEHHIGGALGHAVQRLAAVGSHGHTIPLRMEHGMEKIADTSLVIDDEDMAGGVYGVVRAVEGR
jgi:hypothetical protein